MSGGDNIKKRRYELKMSQQELAEAMGYKTRSTIAKIESGEAAMSAFVPGCLLCSHHIATIHSLNQNNE